VTFYYSVSGLSIQSNSAIPGLRPVENPNLSADLIIFLGSRPDAKDGLAASSACRLSYVSGIAEETGDPMWKMWEIADGGFFHLLYHEGTQFWFDRVGTRLWAVWPENSSVETTALYLLGPVLALILRYRGIVCLHASAVILNGHAVVFVGPEEAGKSTTAAAFSRKGYAILSDDVAPLQERDGAFFALPGSPHLRLWPESVEMIFGPRDLLPRLLPDWEKRRLSDGDQDSRFSQRLCQLGAVYILKDRRAEPGFPRLDTISQRSALMSLVANSYASQLIDSKMRAQELEFFGRLVSQVRVCQLSPHVDGSRINELCDLIRDDLSGFGATSSHAPQRTEE
jgi:hypothetical protein